MNREIKFRAWEPYSKTMYLQAMVGEPANPSVWTKANWRECTENVVVMQSTGLTDKNGKEIFCGDVVKRTTFTRDGEEQKEETSIGEVVYKAPSFGMKLAEYKDWVEPLTDGEFQETGYDGMGREVDFKYEVIGNVFEDNNLLKESK